MRNNWIVQARKQLGLTQSEFAKLLRVSVVTVSRWENGHRNPKAKILEHLATLLGVTPGCLLDGRL